MEINRTEEIPGRFTSKSLTEHIRLHELGLPFRSYPPQPGRRFRRLPTPAELGDCLADPGQAPLFEQPEVVERNSLASSIQNALGHSDDIFQTLGVRITGPDGKVQVGSSSLGAPHGAPRT